MKKLVVGAVLACAGCFARPTELASWGSETRSTSFYTENGLFHLRCAEQRRNDREYLVILVAGGEFMRASGVPQGMGHLHGSGRIRCADGRDIDWASDTRDGARGKVVIGEQTLRLEDGGLVLVDVRGGKVVIDQLAVELSQFDSDAAPEPQAFNAGITYEQLKAIGETEPRMAAFIKACEARK
ncbi:hypothetical protein [Frigoriglobus tundricola]|uniref:Uncharacterized protein n=1 Tax=Frigoriglobus tundricola TaxID=2774151 RepID=A0A6M5YXH4_9BACT|nr:hypothetical protein [Frigoriglobus tundricola]QJW98675.1 hypothetical protein FTUN_6270 [Frigoriglobus tundricola]